MHSRRFVHFFSVGKMTELLFSHICITRRTGNPGVTQQRDQISLVRSDKLCTPHFRAVENSGLQNIPSSLISEWRKWGCSCINPDPAGAVRNQLPSYATFSPQSSACSLNESEGSEGCCLAPQAVSRMNEKGHRGAAAQTNYAEELWCPRRICDSCVRGRLTSEELN